MSNVQIEKSAWTGLGKNKRASSAASVCNCLQDWSPGGRRSVLHFDGLPLTRGVVVATPFAAAISLTFSLVKNLQMLLQAKRQPSYKIPGRVDDRAYWVYDTNDKKNWYEKLKDKTWSCSLSRPLSNKNTPLNYQMQKFLKVKCKSKILKRTMLRYSIKDFKKNNVTIFNPNKSLHGKILVKMVHKIRTRNDLL